MPAKNLDLSKINVEGGTQIRAAVNEHTVTEYAELMKAGVEMPPVEVFFDGMVYWLADGFHRVTAAFEAGLETILANVRTGKKRDAILFACGANSSHGLKRTNADKRRAVETLLSDSEWVKWSDNRIAEAVGVSVPFVTGIRNELATVANSPASKAAAEPRVGKDGKSYPKKEKPVREPKAVPKHVVDTPPAEKRKITGGTAFNVEELTDPPAPRAGKPSSHFDDSRFERAYGPLVKVVAERNAFLGQRKSVEYQRTDKALGELLSAWKDWQKKEPV